MVRNWWAAGLLAAGLLAATGSVLDAQTVSKPAIDVGPALSPVDEPGLPPAPVVSKPTTVAPPTPTSASTTPSVTLPQPKPTAPVVSATPIDEPPVPTPATAKPSVGLSTVGANALGLLGQAAGQDRSAASSRAEEVSELRRQAREAYDAQNYGLARTLSEKARLLQNGVATEDISKELTRLPRKPVAPVVSVTPPLAPPMPTPALAAPSVTLPPPKPATPASKPALLVPRPNKSTSFADSTNTAEPIETKPTLPTPKPVPAIPTSAPTPPMIVPPSPRPTTPESPMVMPGAIVGSTSGPVLPEPSPSSSTSGGTSTSAADDFTPKLKFKVGDNNLLQVETANGLFKVYVGGRVQIDGVWLRTSDHVQAPRADGGIGHVNDAVNFRRARFDIGGTFYKNIDFLMEMDWINTANVERDGAALPVNTPVPTDLWVTFKELPYIGNLRIGNQKPAIGFEHLTSSRFLNFMERSLQFDGFIENQNNGFEPGVAVFDTFFEERGTWNIGVFKNTRNIMGWNVGDGEYQVTGRVTCLPIYENEGEYLVHLGFAASHRDLDDDFDRIRARLLLRNGPAVLHNIVAETQTLGESRDQIAPEFVVVWGPWTFQSEYHRVWEHDAATPVTGTGPRTNYGTVQYQGAYAELLYFLTGEHQHYNRKTGAFGRTTPNSPFRGFGMDGEGCDDDCTEELGLGAWQVGVRYSWLDLNDKGIQGSICQDITVGLNWFLNPYMKWQWNYSALHRDAPGTAHDGWVYGFGTRIAIDF